MRVGRSRIAAIAAVAVVVAACSSRSGQQSAVPTQTTSAAGSQIGSGTAVSAQLQFTAKTTDGSDFDGESLLGKRAVLWFWAPWCPVCQREAPMVAKIAAAYPAVTFVGVAALDQLPAIREFVNKYRVKGFTHLADTDGAVWAKFGVTHQPAYAFVDSDGRVDVVKGSLPEAELTQRVAALSNQ